MKKIVYVGKNNYGHDVFCRIEFDGARLSISGVESPMKSGDCKGGAGQIDMGYRHRNDKDNDKRYTSPSEIVEFSEGWTLPLWYDFLDVWKNWHLNDMRSACEHQRKLGWKYEEHHDKKTFKGEKCPECGYEIGSQWLFEPIPEMVIDFLNGLPETKLIPAWI